MVAVVRDGALAGFHEPGEADVVAVDDADDGVLDEQGRVGGVEGDGDGSGPGLVVFVDELRRQH